MTGSPARLLLLTLGLCCPGIHGQGYQMTASFHNSRTTHPQVGQRLELKCLTTRDDSGIFWIHQDKGGTLHFIVFISSLARNNFEGNMGTSTRFEAKKDGKFYQMVVKSFTPEDEGNYFCFMNINRALYFSPPLPVFLPVTTTTAAPTTQHSITEKDPCLKTLDPETSKEKELNFLCDIFIWVPLAGTCLLLLIALVVTIVLCQQTRRRRCRCRRPANRKPDVKPNTPSHM